MTSATPARAHAGLRARAWRATVVVAGALLAPIFAPSAQAQSAQVQPAQAPSAQAQPASPKPLEGVQQQVSSTPLFAASFKDFDRQLQPLAKYKGQPMLVYFWATWCKSCKQEVPELKALHEKYKGRKLQVIGISADNTDKVREFAKEYAINYTLLLGGNDAIALSKQLGNSVGGLPFAVVIDAKGNIVKTVLGEAPPGRFEELVRPLLM